MQLLARALFMPQAVTIPASGNSAKTRLSPPGLVPYDAKPHLVWRYTPIRAASQGTDVTSCPLLSFSSSSFSLPPRQRPLLLVIPCWSLTSFLAQESSNWRGIGQLGKSSQPWYPTPVPLNPISSHLILHSSPTDYCQYISDCLYRLQPGLLILKLTGPVFVDAIYT